ncbi:MAG: zinc metalloprotease [Actinobacteria bacterium]|nr:zinc metalloprotease [Actinomycetota bacterium]
MSPDPRPRHRQCGTMQVNERLSELDPKYRERRLQIEQQTARSIASGEAQGLWQRLITIPVVVHVVYKNKAENVSDAQVTSQMDVLNKDYRATNPDTKKVPPVWKSLVADPKIQFKLATTDPKGKPTNGITRTATTVDSFGSNDTVKTKAGGGTAPWPTERYLNMWVANLADGLLGYAQFPGGPAATDGVVILYTAFGTKGTAADPFNLGRTATHEVGHWLNLRHIWGDRTDCSGSDEVPDTPKAQMPNHGKPTFPHLSCNNGPSGDMFMNYMDYVDDAAMFMFTPGQAARMNAALAGPRKKLAGASA